MSATLALTLGAGFAQAQTTECASVDSAGTQGNSVSYRASISSDGRYVAFDSDANNLVAGDTNGVVDVFVHDRTGGTTERVSIGLAGAQANDGSARPALSADGRFVAFLSSASNLVTGDTNATYDIFVYDRLNATTERVSVSTSGSESNGYSWAPSISADGRFVAFESAASNLVAGDTNGVSDIFVHDRLSGTTERVSVDSSGAQTGGSSESAALSADGRWVAFESASNLVAGDTNGVRDIYVHDRLSGVTERVSVDSAGVQTNDRSNLPSISADGRCVAFRSDASNLVAGDTNMLHDVFVHDRQSGMTERVSVSTNGAQGNLFSENSSLSADGRFIAFESLASNLVAGDTNGSADIFVHDRLSGTTERVSVDSGGMQADNESVFPSFSADGRLVAFMSLASNLVAGDANGAFDVFARDRGAQPPVAFCFGDGSAGACPCANNGTGGRGCENSSSTGGALLGFSGAASLASDSLVLTSTGELQSVLSIFLQGDSAIAAANFGDGRRCVGGALKRLYARNALGGAASAPPAGALSISARSAFLGDAISAGSTRFYQTYYRDPILGFCPSPQGNSWNISSGLAVVWSQ